MKNCKKLIALCLALATVFSFTVFASAAGTDISASGDSASADRQPVLHRGWLPDR